jgi:hypothetical protein
MKITKQGNELIIDGMHKTTVNLKKGEEKMEIVGFDDFEIQVNNFNFITHDTKYYFGQDVEINQRIFKYIGIDKSKKDKPLIFWDVKNEIIVLGSS